MTTNNSTSHIMVAATNKDAGTSITNQPIRLLTLGPEPSLESLPQGVDMYNSMMNTTGASAGHGPQEVILLDW